MKCRFLCLAVLACTITAAHGQLWNKIKNSAKQKVENRTVQQTDKVIDGSIDKALENKNAKKDTVVAAKKADAPVITQDTAQDISIYSKSDFVPGEKIIVFEDFMQDAVGEFPEKWNTTAGGEVVKINGKDGNWLKLNDPGVYMPSFINQLPENFTLEFDLICNRGLKYEASPFYFAVAQLKTPQEYTRWMQGSAGRNGFNTWLHPMAPSQKNGRIFYEANYADGSELNGQYQTPKFFSGNKTQVKVSVWRQKQRIRIYLDEEKVIDVAKALPGASYNALVFQLSTAITKPDYYLISNIRLAQAAPVNHSKLITEGKWTTTGIYFSVNSDKIKPESYQAINAIATQLQQNPAVRINIIGHTDSDGDAASNLSLSKKRAAAVKAFLINEFKIEEERIKTDGKGEAEPADKANTAAAKANNRRVEFVKIP